MRIRVTYVQPRVGTTWVDARIGVTYRDIAMAVSPETELKHRAIDDLVNAVDGVLIAFGKGLVDAVDVADAIQYLQVGKVLADSVTLAESIVTTTSFVRALDEAVPMSDAVALNIVKVLADAVEVDDLFNLVGGSAIADGLSIDEAIAIATQKVLADTVGMADTGLLRMQDYADYTYFAEDYVGTSRSF